MPWPFRSPNQFMKRPYFPCTMTIAASMLTAMPSALMRAKKSQDERHTADEFSPYSRKSHDRRQTYKFGQSAQCLPQSRPSEPAEHLLRPVCEEYDAQNDASKSWNPI